MVKRCVIRMVRTLVICSFLSGCDLGPLWYDGHYLVLWIDGRDRAVLYYSRDIESYMSILLGGNVYEQRVPPEIIAVGSDNYYVVAKRKFLEDEKIMYYYIDKRKDGPLVGAQEVVVGPMTEEEFEVQRTKLNLPAMKDL